MDISRRSTTTVWLIVFTLLRQILGQNTAGTCDLILWSEPTYEHVTDVTVGCIDGHVTWNAPFGALRVTMQLGKQGTRFQGCFLATARVGKIKISHEDTKKHSDGSNLQTLAILNETRTRTRKEICLESRNSQIVLYIEVEPNGRTQSIGKVRIDYDLHRRYKTLGEDNMQECKPCSDTEILNSFCSSDFVVAGSMSSVVDNHALDESHLHLNVDRVFRQSMSPFKRHLQAGKKLYSGVVITPRSCGISHGSGQFMFTGRMRLGKALLHCAPFVEEWELIKRTAIKKGVNPCKLE